MYHNTTESTGHQLRRYQGKAKSQEDQILEWFKTYGRQATPSKLCKLIYYNRVPITSVRRAFTNLTVAGKLTKTNRQKKGPYGRPEFLWKLADKYRQGQLF